MKPSLSFDRKKVDPSGFLSRSSTPHHYANRTKMGSFGSSSSSESQPHQLNLKVGAEVEVSSDEEGFRGSWYIATVLDPFISKKNRKARVEYRTLLTEDGSQQLKEEVDFSYVRPVPPKEVVKADSFVEGEIVGAYCRDGWWTGVVKKDLGNSKYRVFFENPPDVIEFDLKDLRLHLEWREGKWLPPDKEKKAQSIFSSGKDVEVNIKQEILRDAWFPAIVIKENGDDTFLVKCQTSRNGDEAGLEKITVDFLHIRPPPPPPPHVNKKYDVLEKVDAFCDFAWRPGVIVKLQADKNFLVFFKLANENRVINQSEIRPHVEWKDGKWVSGSEEVAHTSDFQEKLVHARNNTSNPVTTTQVESSGVTVAKDKIEDRIHYSTKSVKNLMEQSPFDGKEVTSSLTPSMKTIKVPSPNGSATRTHPSKKLKTENAAEVPLSITACKSRRTPSKVSTKVLSRMATPNRGGKGTKFSGDVGNQPFAKTESFVGRRKVWTKQQKLGKLDGQRTEPLIRKRRYIKTPVKYPLISAAGKKGNAGDGTAKESVQEVVKKDGIPFILGLEAKGMGALDSENPRHSNQKKDTNHSTEDKCMDIDNQKSGGNSNKRKRGRPRKLVITNSAASEGGQEQNGVRGATDETVVKDHPTQGVASDVLTGEKSTDSHDTSRRKLTEVSGTNCLTNDVGMTSIGASDNMDDDDRPLSAWIGTQGPTSVNEPRLPLAGTADEHSESREGQIVIAQQVPATDATGDCVLDENRNLPFVKSSSLWKTIESMEIFRILPQDPHFRPLDKCREPYREGLAIGNMVTFSSLVEKISKLRFDDPRNILDSHLESLRELEKHGFDVTLLKSRLNELLSIKDRQVQILNESKDAEGKILLYDREKTEMAEEMANITMKIVELQEKRASMESEMENKKLEIARLQMHANAIKEDVQNTQLNFEKLAAAPWKSG